MFPTKSFFCVLTISIFISSILYQATAGHHDDGSVEQRHNRPNKRQMKQKFDSFTFYWHDIVSGEKPTAITIVKPVNGSSLVFGAINMIDDPLTRKPDPDSELLGRAQGFYAGASQETEMAFLMVMNFVFITGKYNGSTISIMGRNPAGHPVREMSVVGGTGLFRFARGYAQASTIQLNVTGDAVVRYDVHVMHYVYLVDFPGSIYQYACLISPLIHM